MNRPEYAILVAGGKGTRIKSDVPKQFIELNGVPVLIHTINAFYHYSSSITIILVLPEGDFATWNSLAEKYDIPSSIILQKGGETRFQSVKNGLEKIQGDGLVAIHDGVRPLVTKDIISKSFEVAAAHGSAVAAVRCKDSIRMVEAQFHNSPDSHEITKSLDRSLFRIVQTPQTFEVAIVKNAYLLNEDLSFTDDASVVENAGESIHLFDGSYSNIKITTQEDLVIAETLLKMKS